MAPLNSIVVRYTVKPWNVVRLNPHAINKELDIRILISEEKENLYVYIFIRTVLNGLIDNKIYY